MLSSDTGIRDIEVRHGKQELFGFCQIWILRERLPPNKEEPSSAPTKRSPVTEGWSMEFVVTLSGNGKVMWESLWRYWKARQDRL
jgi:hypothetical protein